MGAGMVGGIMGGVMPQTRKLSFSEIDGAFQTFSPFF